MYAKTKSFFDEKKRLEYKKLSHFPMREDFNNHIQAIKEMKFHKRNSHARQSN